MPDCTKEREGMAVAFISYSPGKVMVCSDGMWTYLKDISYDDARKLPKYDRKAEDASKILVERGSVTDSRDGRTYKTVKIGSQTWFAENLEYGYEGYEDYYSLCFITSGSRGCLYTWEDLNDIGFSRNGVCPSGYHVPSKEDWNLLIETAGGYQYAGIALQADDGFSKDSYSFSVYPSGYYDSDASYIRDRYSLSNEIAPFWTSTRVEYSNSNAFSVLFNKGSSDVSIRKAVVSDGYAVRCLKD